MRTLHIPLFPRLHAARTGPPDVADVNGHQKLLAVLARTLLEVRLKTSGSVNLAQPSREYETPWTSAWIQRISSLGDSVDLKAPMVVISHPIPAHHTRFHCVLGCFWRHIDIRTDVARAYGSDCTTIGLKTHFQRDITPNVQAIRNALSQNQDTKTITLVEGVRNGKPGKGQKNTCLSPPQNTNNKFSLCLRSCLLHFSKKSH